MGKTFQNLGNVLSPLAAAGHLTFNRLNGERMDQRVNGIGELGKLIVQQPEYVSCQVEWFWKQFIGQDVVLYPDRKEKLIEIFNSVGHRVGDFIKTLVGAPEFVNRPVKLDHIAFAQVAPLLNRCNTCHQANELGIAKFEEGNFTPDLLAEMRRRVNLPDYDESRMPRNWPIWRPQEIEMVKNWLDQSTGGVSP
jgi:hypothetical protein